MKILAGIDGGGTRTRLALAAENGNLLAVAEGGACSFSGRGAGAAGARRVLAGLWRSAWRRTGAAPCRAHFLFMGMGSVLTQTEARSHCALAVSAGMARPGRAAADNDASNALAGGLAGRPGILLISGTGSACLGRNSRGETWRAGGWGHLLNDTGSAHAFGLAAMIAATRGSDGRGRPTALTALVRKRLGLRDIKEIYRKLHHGDGLSRSEVAALAPEVVARAAEGDAVARRILGDGAAGLVEMAVTVARRLGLKSPEIALTGGLISNAGLFRKMFLARLAGALPGFTLARGGFAPVLGAVMLACERSARTAAPPEFLENLRRGAGRFAASIR